MVPHSPRAVDPGGAPLDRRTPGDTDLRIFTTEVLPAGRHRPSPQRRRLRVVRDGSSGRATVIRLGVLTLAGVLAAGCSTGTDTAGQDGPPRAAGPLSDVCPAKVVMQAAWWPTADLALPFQLLGSQWSADSDRKRVTGQLMDGATPTGVELEFRSGGPATGFQTGPAVAYADKDVTLAFTNVDEIIGLSSRQPMTAVMAPLNGDPQVLIWDPATHPEFATVQDVGQTDTRIVHSANASTVFGYLTGAGILRAGQLDSSYDGSPSRFVAARGRDVVQGYATNEPHVYETLPAWGKPVRYGLVQDTGYPNYANVLAVRSGDRDRLAGCLDRLVPVMQRALVAFMDRPGPALDKIVKAVAAFRAGFAYDRAAAVYGACQLRTLGLVSDTISGVAGGFDPSKLQRMIDITRPVFAAQRNPLRDDLAPADIATSEHLDTDLSLPATPRLAGVTCPTGSTR